MKIFTNSNKRVTTDSQGNALVEFALTFPTLAVVTLMIFDLGQALLAYTTVSNVAAEGARYAAVHGTGSTHEKTADEISAYITGRAAGLNPANITVTVSYDPSNSSGSEVEVQVDYQVNYFLSGVFETVTGELDTSITVSGVSTMTVL